MSLFRRRLVYLFALPLLMLAVGTARADDNRFAVVTVNNDTPDVTLHFAYHWGSAPWEQLSNLRPGQAHWFAYPLDASGNAPPFQVQINEGIGSAASVLRTFNLNWRAAPDRGVSFGEPYSIQRDRSNSDYISVYHK
jgi:hypothetical protein